MKTYVAIGAHPSYPDKENFGRKDLIDISIRREDLIEIIVEQVNRLKNICLEFGTNLHHIKPHGALYNRAARDKEISSLICKAILQIDPSLILYGLSGSEMKNEADACKIKFASEVFADRTYQEDGSLTTRDNPHALIENEEQALNQVIQMIKTGTVQSLNGKIDTYPGRNNLFAWRWEKAVEFAQLINDVLLKEGIVMRHH